MTITVDECLTGTLEDDDLTATVDTLKIEAYSGDDFAWGGDNDEVIEAGTTDRNLFRTYGDDDEAYGGGGDDRVFGRLGDDKLYGDEGNDFLNGGGGSDHLNGGADDGVFQGGFVQTISVLSPDDVLVSQIDEPGEYSDPIFPGRYDAGSDTFRLPFLSNLPDGGALFRLDNGGSETATFVVNSLNGNPDIIVENVPPGSSVVVNVGDVTGQYNLLLSGEAVSPGVSSTNDKVATINDSFVDEVLKLGDIIAGGGGDDTADYFLFDGEEAVGGVDRLTAGVEQLNVFIGEDYEAEVIQDVRGNQDLMVFVSKADGSVLQDNAILFDSDATNVDFFA